MNKIKVCHIITMLELGGAQINTLYTVSKLDRERFTPVLISGAVGILDEETYGIAGLKTYFVRELVRPIRPLSDLIAVAKIYRLLRAERPDIVHTHSSKAGILGRIAASLARVPVVIHTYHGFGFNDFQNILSRQAFIMAEKIVAPLATRFIAVTKEDIAKGLRYGIGPEEKYSLIRSGIDASKYSSSDQDKARFKKELGIDPEDRVVTTIGPFKPQKNLLDFVRACSLIVKGLPASRFLIVGDGEQRAMIEALVEKLGLKDRVELLGWRKDIERILNATDVFVMTSLWEGLPRSILEAMSLGLPVVANAVDGIKEIVNDGVTGYLVRPRDIETLSEKVLHILNNPDAAAEMGKKARGSIDRQYDINYMVKQQEELYVTLSKEKHGNTK